MGYLVAGVVLIYGHRHALLRGPHGTMSVADDDLVTPGGLEVPASALLWRFSRSSGPGGQHANTSDTRVELICEVAAINAPEHVRQRLIDALGTSVVVTASDERSQVRNRRLARARLAEILDRASRVQARRRATRPRRGAVEERLASKRVRSKRKSDRSWTPED